MKTLRKINDWLHILSLTALILFIIAFSFGNHPLGVHTAVCLTLFLITGITSLIHFLMWQKSPNPTKRN